jgi:hypothetical protein
LIYLLPAFRRHKFSVIAQAAAIAQIGQRFGAILRRSGIAPHLCLKKSE